MKKSMRNVCLAACSGLLVSATIVCGNKTKDIEKKDELPVDISYKWYTPPLPDTMSFAGERVPLERWEIKEQLDREMTFNYYWQGNILYILKLSYRYFPLIEQKLKANNIPDDMKYLCVAESNLQNLVSRAGATGFWQFMRSTAPSYGLEISNEVDEREHVAKSTDAACIYLRQAYQKLGSWTAAAASYNCGQGGYNNNATFQRTANYYDLMLPEETNRYIFRILTFKYFLSNARALGYMIGLDEGYKPLDMREIAVTKSIPNLVTFAQQEGTTYKMLKICNPWLKARSLTVRPGKTYTILLPKK
jgi:membrane-bound lytic murein transglycosylase D